MSDSNPSELILAVPGPEQMRAFPKKWVRAAIAKGQLSRSQLIWSPNHNEWKQLRDLPHLMPTREIAPLPQPIQKPANLSPKIAASEPVKVPTASTGSVKVAKPSIATTGTVKSGAIGTAGTASSSPSSTQTRPKSTGATKTPVKLGKKVAEEKDFLFPILRTVAICSFILLAIILGGNYYFIEAPFAKNLNVNGWGNIYAYANLGGFYQFDVLTVHLIPSGDVTRDNFLKTVIAVAKCSPKESVNGQGFIMVSLTPGLSGGYLIPATDWKDLPSIADQTPAQQEIYLLHTITKTDGHHLLDNDDASQDAEATGLTDRETRAWDLFMETFVPLK